MMGIHGVLRQFVFPKEFRIGIEEFGMSCPVVEEVKQIIAELKKLPSDPSDQLPVSFVAELSSNIWRVNKRLKLASDELTQHKAVKGIENMVNRLSGMLERHEIRIEDFSGEQFDPDEIWDEVTGDTEVDEGVIEEMGRPRILYRGIVIQRGIPIVRKGGRKL
ncbi:MAG: hypothetical protein KZQ96_19795 [Candidatus Thiodiazotropha sp. (ex Lucinoma borealis)]|nr:hypothetical protein [Candidatus Thiodiazotropha sp. (ex Lucinoma borealis)]